MSSTMSSAHDASESSLLKEEIRRLEQELEKQSRAFDEFQAESRELEIELDREISSRDEEVQRLRVKVASVTAENEEWKVRTSSDDSKNSP